MMNLPSIAILVLSLTALSSAQGNEVDRELGQQFLYCGELKMRLAKVNKNRELGEQEYRKAEELMLVSIASLIPIEEMDSEHAKAAARLSKDISAKREQEKGEPGAWSDFLVDKYFLCDKLQKEKGSEIYKRGVEALSRRK